LTQRKIRLALGRRRNEAENKRITQGRRLIRGEGLNQRKRRLAQ